MNDDRRDLFEGIGRLRSRVDPPTMPRVIRQIVHPNPTPGGAPILGDLLDRDEQGRFWVAERKADGSIVRLRLADLGGTAKHE